MKHVRYSAPMLLILLLAAIPLIVQCTTSSQTSARFSAVEKDPLIGSWVQPAPGSDGDETYIIKHLDDKKLVLSIPAEGTKDSNCIS
ncbi:MAG: hypothetical protein DRG83_20745 [Deltaproteobacteria bacterium]|nr:MAG: hypothetical protein DRG83_20745 [Deltaproteobacteria bacterium]